MSEHEYEARMRVLDAARKSVSIYDGPAVFLEGFAKLPTAVGDLLATHWVVSEVNNGAFPQFFANSTGVLAPEAASGLLRMGLEPASAAVVEAMALFSPVYPRERKPRHAAVNAATARNASPEASAFLDQLLRLSLKFLESLGHDCVEYDDAFERYLLAHVPVV